MVRFDTGDFNTGAALVTKIAEAADEANHHPDVDLRYPHLTVSLSSHDVDAITPRDIRLARKISELAADAGVSATRARARRPGVGARLARHGRACCRSGRRCWATNHTSATTCVDGAGRSPNVWFQETDSDAPDRQRWHLDVSVPHDVAEERLAAAIAAGGTLVSDDRAPAYWVLADPEGNKACICTWQSRD